MNAGGEGGWDYLNVDSQARRIYISRGDHVDVVDADTGSKIGTIPNTPGVHGIALAPRLGRGFTSNGREGTVTIFDIKSLKEIGRVQVGTGPDCSMYDPATHRVRKPTDSRWATSAGNSAAAWNRQWMFLEPYLYSARARGARGQPELPGRVQGERECGDIH